ncbi:VWA domain-containing protein [Variovorax sp. OV329]|uniref:VWA domain-containing protein n=1 Tax=Variovorax sp. OV329 TaxID=1882825 RepID=UPI0008E79A06|nr:VWA domain-containing protein [Variovorax sp. OV329]SFN11422.1 Ca-activated chloride channel family protein [Variovorax sp. OV329]
MDTLAQFHFLRPWWLLALLPAALLLWAIGRRDDVRKRWGRSIAPHLLDALVVERRSGWRLRPVHLTSALMALGALAMAGPAWERERPPFLEEKAPLAIAIDLSPTMDASDLSPTRLERAKLKVKALLALRQGARTAIYAYAGSTHLVLPLTDDARLIQTFVDALQTGIMPRPGRNTVLALRTIDADMAKEDTPGTIVFFTDGVEPGATEAFKAQVDSGRSLPVVLGFGTAQGGPIKAQEGGAPEAGRPRFARLDVDALKRLGREADVPVATVTPDSDEDVQWVQHRVQSHLAQKESESDARWKEAGWWLLIPIALLSALWFRKGWTVRWVGAWLVAVFVAGAGMPRDGVAQLVPRTADEPAAAADAPTPARQWRFIDLWLTPDQQGRRAFESGDFEAAAAQFQDPTWRGMALYRLGRYEAAQQAFAQVDSPESDFNQGNALAWQRRFPDAAQMYTLALERRPDWKEAKANLALVQAMLAQQDKDEGEEAPDLKPDKLQFDKRKLPKGGKEEQVLAAQNAETWMRNIQTSPTELLARKFMLQAQQPAPGASSAPSAAGAKP